MKRLCLESLLLLVLLVSVFLNLFFWRSRPSARPQEVPASAAKPEPSSCQAPPEKKAVQKTPPPVLFKSVTYDEYSEAVQVEFGEQDIFSLNDLSAHVSCEPPLPLKVSNQTWQSGCYLLEGKFLPGRVYLFRVKAGLTSEQGGRLRRNLIFSVKIPDHRPSARFLADGLYFPLRNSSWILPAELVNVDRLRIEIRHFHNCNLNPFGLNNDWETRAYQERVLEKDISLSGEKNKTMDYPLDLKKLLGDCRPGAYRIQLSYLQKNRIRPMDDRVFFITDLGITAAENSRQQRIECFVRRVSDGSGVAGARLSLFSTQKRLLARIQTDGEGHGAFDLNALTRASGEEPAKLMAEDGTDINLLELRSGHDLSEFIPGEKAALLEGCRAFLYTERGIYRGGETVFFNGFVRSYEKGFSRPLKQAPMELFLYDPFGTILWQRRITTDAHGAAAGSFRLPAGTAAGYYTLVCGLGDKDGITSWGRCSFQAGDFVPDRLEVGLKPSGPVLMSGDVLDWASSAKYYFGPSVEKASAQFSIQVSQAEFPAHWKGYAVGNPSGFRPAVLFKTVRRNYHDGDVFQYRYEQEYFQPVQLTGVLSVSEPGGNAVSCSASAVQLKTPEFLGLKYSPDAGDCRNAEVRCRFLPYAADPDYSLWFQSMKIKFRLHRLEWRYALRKAGREWKREWIQERIPMPEPGSMDLGKGEKVLKLQNLAAGCYELEAAGTDHCTVLNFWHEAGAGGVRSSNPNILVPETDRNEYRPGDTASVFLDSPEPGQVMAFCGEKSLAEARCFPVRAGRNELKIRIPGRMETDRYYCGLTLVCGKNSRHRLFTILGLKVNQESRRLMPELSVPDQARPGETIRGEVVLRDAAGGPAGGFVQILAVDEGILSLTDYPLPDPFAFFFRNFRCETGFYDTYGNFYPEIALPKNGRVGGDRGMLKKMSLKRGLEFRRRKSAVVVLGGRYVSPGGKAVFSLRLPEHTGRLRLMAVAMGEQQAGSAQKSMVLRNPAVILGSMPEKLAPGDEFQLTIQAFNHDFPEANFRIRAEFPAGLVPLDPPEKTIRLKQGGREMMIIRCRAEDNPGNKTVKISLERGSFRVEEELFVQIRHLTLPEVRTELLVLQPGQGRTFARKTAEKAGVHSEIQVLSSPLQGVREALDWLNAYPYGCLEQITAGAFPLLAARKLQQAGLISAEEELNSRDKIQMVCNELISRKLPAGGFAGWPGSSTAWKEAGVFAAHFLFLARRGGFFRMAPDMVRVLRNEMEKICRSSDENIFLRGYALYVWALSGQDCARTARALLQQNAGGPAELMAAGALFECGYAREAASFLKTALDQKVWLSDQVPYAFAGPASRLGMIMAIAGEILPEDPRLLELVRVLQLGYQGGGRGWGNTQDNAWACYGLMQIPALSGDAVHPAEARLEFKDGRTLHYRQGKAMTVKDSLPVTIRNTGRVPVYLQQTVSGILKPEPEPVQNRGLKIRRFYLDDQGREAVSFSHGDLITVRIQFEAVRDIRNLAVADMIPGGLAIEDSRLASRSLAPPPEMSRRIPGLQLRYMENGADRMLLFGALEGGRTVEFTYRLRAVARGRFKMTPCQAEDMYDTGISGQHFQPGILEIR